MFRIVIVDDELETIKGISNCICWNNCDIEVVGQARNGIQALDLVRAVKPDILLTDIKMPKMDGIQLSKILKEELPELKIIFITGYSDINYIKSAFKYDVIDYILKPVDPEELESVITKTVDTCRQEKSMGQKRIELEAKIRESMPLLQERFFRLLISDDLKNREDILCKMNFLEIDLPEVGYYMILTINIDDYYLLQKNYSVYKKQQMSFFITGIISEVVNNYTKGVAFEFNENEFIAIISFAVDSEACNIEEMIEIIANEIKSNLNKYLDLSITIGVGEWVDRIEKLTFSFQRAMFAAKQKLLSGKNRIFYVDITKHGYLAEIPMNIKEVESVYIGLRLGSYERTRNVTSEIFTNLKNLESVDKQFIHGICLQLISVINRIMNEFHEDLSEAQINLYDLVNHLFRLETLEDIQTFILSAFKKICDGISKYQYSSSKKVVEDIKSIIYKRYNEDITINSIAKDVYLTTSYICLLFKQETGETINDFLTKYRIEKAKELLNGKNNKLYEISMKVGYSDPKYFSKIFKKHTGVNPSEFTKSNDH